MSSLLRNVSWLFNLAMAGFTLALIVSCCTIDVGPMRLTPSYGGVDPLLQGYVSDYINLAKEQNITFDRSVTVGFRKINEGAVIGSCWMNKSFREIDIDSSFWKESSPVSRRTLVYHELTHCYCGRDHDYAKGKEYATENSSNVGLIAHLPFHRAKPTLDQGFYGDGCPLSIMYPTISDDSCVNAHYSEYMREIFERCRPY